MTAVSAVAARAELAREHDAVGLLSARRCGVVFTVASLLHILALPGPQIVAAMPAGLLLLASTVVLVGRRRPGGGDPRILLVSAALQTIALGLFLLPGIDDGLSPLLGGVSMLASMAVPTALLAMGHRRSLPLVALAGFVLTGVLSTAVTGESGRAVYVAGADLAGWLTFTVAARWLATSVERASVGTARLRTAHEAERRSSESEARRRTDARLMHDTILATLTLLAHRGQGVAAGTLRSRAAADLDLLRRLDDDGEEAAGELRDDTDPTGAPVVDGPGVVPPPALAELDRRIAALGTEVVWHGVLRAGVLPPPVLDALAQAVGECLENVRRHSGVRAADVTVTEEPEVVRVVVSDAGVGFDPAAVPVGRLGLAQSVIGRIDAVGGSVRVFSAPGYGTTVLVSVPR